LILYLHGSGDRGDNLDYLLFGGLPKKLQEQPDFPAIVVSPQGHGGIEFWSKPPVIQSLIDLLEEVQAKLPIDLKRIYLTGVSAGGNGTWELGLQEHSRFAALVPVMGYYGYPFLVPGNICDLKETPIWAFHGAKDGIVPLGAEKGLVEAVQACGGSAQLTVFPNAGHSVDQQAYDTPELYTWLFAQKLK
jgi:predicted peptidase